MAQLVSFGTTFKILANPANTTAAPTQQDTVQTSSLLTVGECTSLSFDGVAQSTIETTSLASAVKIFQAGLLDPGSISAEVNYDSDDTGILALQLALTTRLKQSYEIFFGGSGYQSTKITGIGIVTSLSIKAGLDAVMTASFTIKCSGAYTITPTS
jgi:hypothetical protein